MHRGPGSPKSLDMTQNPKDRLLSNEKDSLTWGKNLKYGWEVIKNYFKRKIVMTQGIQSKRGYKLAFISKTRRLNEKNGR